ncbi:hypothetical protein [Tepidibacter aestuarii]|uniref:hypothetical protein n=1 Tax=Tepidibacter aestuarii TaxID=2925782 RepID=UPI0020C18405|nr:hypothetical protein [Tepidibacter aestuarii]CAH2212905.1 stage II sporulation protein M [Tepidibacter aestuarii]
MKNIFKFSSSNCNYKIIMIIFIFLFSLGVTSGAYLNKIYSISDTSMNEFISRTTSDYNQNFNLIGEALLNLKNDFIYLISMYLASLFVITSPLVLVIVFLKGLSIGYTVNTLILVLKSGSIKMIFLILMKNIVIIPFTFLVIFFSFNYFFEAIHALKISNRFKNYNHIKKLMLKYSINLIGLFAVIVTIQGVVNLVSIFIMQKIF